MNEKRRQILEKLAADEITADEAEQLIAALEDTPDAADCATKSDAQPTFVWIV
jgi:hypothetical protein